MKHFYSEKFIQSFVSGEKVNKKSTLEEIVEEPRSFGTQRLHQAQLDTSQGTDEPLNHTLEDYQYFDIDFDQILSSSHQVSQPNM